MAITSATVTLIAMSVKVEIQKQQKIGITSAIKLIKIDIYTNKIKGYTNTHTPSCVGNNLEQHFPQTWKKP